MNQQQAATFINEYQTKIKHTISKNYKIIITIFILSMIDMFLSMLFTLITEFYTRLFLFIPFGFIMGLAMSFCFIIYIQNDLNNDDEIKKPTVKIQPDVFGEYPYD